MLSFANGEPTEPADSTTAAKDVLTHPDTSGCPGKCFRPAGLTLDSQGRIFMTSDSTGEIYVLQQTGADGTGTSSPSGTGTGTPNMAPGAGVWLRDGWSLVGLTLALSVIGGVFLMVA